MNFFEKFRTQPAFWPVSAGILLWAGLFVTFLLLSIAYTGCADGAVCFPGETACDEDLVLICGADGHWNTLEDCNQYEPADYFELIQFTCCTIDAQTGCYLDLLCDMQAQYCQQVQYIADIYCLDSLTDTD